MESAHAASYISVLWAARFILQRHNMRRGSCRLGYKPRACVQSVIRRGEQCATPRAAHPQPC
jgi:hypothetical protein